MMCRSNCLALVMALTFSLQALACSIDGKSGIVPENDLYIPVASKNSSTGITKEEFNSIIAETEAIYAPIIARKGAQLSIQKSWTDGTVNARAIPEGNKWILKLYGGMARHPEMTADGYALVVCHELGHHLGGAPKKTFRWATSEGQADYFATLKCLRKMFLNDDNRAALKGKKYSLKLINSCKEAWPNKEDYYICVRSGAAGLSLANVFKAMRGASTPPNFTTPANNTVSTTNLEHPHYQCRLDTYFQGSLCTVDETVELSNSNERLGVCHPRNGHTTGNRPACWYKSR